MPPRGAAGPGGQHILFDGTEIRVRDATLPGDTDTLVISFPPANARQALRRKGFGEEFLARKGISAIIVTAAWNHWFQSAESEAAIRAVGAVARRFRRVVTYGASMGGHAALLFSGRLDADAAIAISPQFSIDRTKMPGERRWAEEAGRIAFTDDDLPASMSRRATIHVLYDPLHQDRLHAEAILAAAARPAPLLVPLGGHLVGTMMRDMRLISSVVERLIRGGHAPRGMRQEIRARRRDTSSYWSQLAGALYRARRPAALQAARRAVALAPEDHVAQFCLGRAAIRADRADEAVEAMRAAVALLPDRPAYHLELGAALLRARRFEEAIEAAARVERMAPQDPRPARLMAAIHRTMGRVSGAP